MPFLVRHVLASSALLVAFVACGGRYAHNEDQGSGASTGSGGSGQGGAKAGGKAGNSSTAGSSTVGGKSTGTSGTSGCACPTIDFDCAPGHVKQLDPSGCCELCVPLDCTLVPCPGVACGSDSQLVYPPGQCCPVCSPGTCQVQYNAYYAYRSELIEKYNSLGCMVDADCTLLYDANACTFGCSGAPIPAAYEKELLVSLQSFGDGLCAGCPPLPIPPCEPSLPAACVQGRCQIRPLR